MFRFFDFVYLKATSWYKNEAGVSWTGSAVVAMFQSFNILSLLFPLQHYIGFYITSKLFIVIVFIILMIYNDRRYFFQKKNSYSEIRKRLEGLTLKELNVITSLVIFYMVVSTITFFGIAIFIGAKK